ncbi:protein of unknown function (plasmid) [Paraburkholderia dioscoreae]|uniref:Uncharacterized protein n=1 Tax=Paraburkholderia dioscoreae TaxID=2604047 RepID=A0A5Q4YV46_9BURK|nr:protein of unknown function [Paraburkholderia dioscoreae]
MRKAVDKPSLRVRAGALPTQRRPGEFTGPISLNSTDRTGSV